MSNSYVDDYKLFIKNNLWGGIQNVKVKKGLYYYSRDTIPSIEVDKYIDRWVIYSNILEEPYILFISSVYIKRLLINKSIDNLSLWNIYRIIAITLTLAIKYFIDNDYFYSNKYYAKVSGMELWEFNYIEEKALQDINWNLNVNIYKDNDYSDTVGFNTESTESRMDLDQSPRLI